MQYNGRPALGLGISTVSDGNVATMGKAVRERIRELETNRPVGMELGIIAYQSDTVTEAVDGFIVNLIEAVLIVICVLCVFMGFSSGMMIGAVLLLNIFGTFILMDAMDISLQLISLGALILALGMLVDNAIVVTEGILVRVRKGADRYEAAAETVSQTMWPLLGATFVAILAFAAIGVSQDSTGEFCGSLFTVLAISLSLSWVLAITLTPLFCIMFLQVKDNQKTDDPYGGGFFQKYRRLLNTCLRWRWITVGCLVALLACSVYGFGFVEESFFPKSRRPQFMIDYWRPEGTHIKNTSE
ncbi:MAG: efflux RND transporter permease subunit, partial [Gammaproteobacteria bacterium]|nr:efflux RND transporter permease subunit [Gammaproteobacteria bacterium]